LAPQPINSSTGVKELKHKTPVNGLHIVANFTVSEISRLTDPGLFRDFIDLLISEFQLSKVGEVYHRFDNGGFTGVVCLTESHLSIHTWPELNYVTFDVFLSNYLKDNRVTTHALYNSVRDFFSARVSFEQFIER
jgi:S-adenosylmethionine decarboxylase